MKENVFGRGGASFALAFAGSSISAFVFHVALSRLVGPGSYGIMNSLISILALLAVPLGALQIAVTQAVVSSEKKGEPYSIHAMIRQTLLGSFVAALLVFASAPFTDYYLGIKSVIPMLLISSWVPLAALSALLQGALLGEYRFRPVAFATFVGTGIVRLVLGVAMVWWGWGVNGAIFATVVSQALTALSLAYSAGKRLSLQPRHVPIRATLRDVILSVVATAGCTMLITIDTFLSRHFLHSIAAGQYAAAVLASHSLIFVTAALATIIFPHLAEGEGVTSVSRRMFRQGVWLAVIFSVLTCVVMVGLPHLVIRILFGKHYGAAASILGTLSEASALIGLSTLYVYLHLARRSLFSLVPWLGVAAIATVVTFLHRTMQDVADVVLVISGVTFALTSLPALRFFRAASEVTPG
jgi:O-antigen/teichoic acid export membrane protein